MVSIKTHIEVFPESRQRIKKKKKPFEEQTIVGNISNDLSYYYQWFLDKRFGIKLEPPPFGCHITINNGREEIDINQHKTYLKTLNKQVLTVNYDPTKIYRKWEFFCLPVYSKELHEIRKNLKLSYVPFFHITLGRIHPHHKIILPSSLTQEI